MLEKQGFCFSGGTPHDSCGNCLLRTLSADLANTQFHPLLHFPLSLLFLPALPGRTQATPICRAGMGRGLLGKQLE